LSGKSSPTPEEEPPDEIERSRSDHTFFASPDGEGFTFKTEAEGIREREFMTDDFAEAGWREEPPVGRISGTGKTGVAVSLLAPFASESGRIQRKRDLSPRDIEFDRTRQSRAAAWAIVASIPRRVASTERLEFACLVIWCEKRRYPNATSEDRLVRLQNPGPKSATHDPQRDTVPRRQSPCYLIGLPLQRYPPRTQNF